jgi:hypothetical protein
LTDVVPFDAAGPWLLIMRIYQKDGSFNGNAVTDIPAPQITWGR